MRDSGYIVDENPVYGQRCSSIRINGGFPYCTSLFCRMPQVRVQFNHQLPGGAHVSVATTCHSADKISTRACIPCTEQHFGRGPGASR